MSGGQPIGVRLQRHAGAACLRAPGSTSLAALEDELTGAFGLIRAALQDGEPVVVAVADAHLRGEGETASVALAHGLLGLVRALAIEGSRGGWRINMLAVAPGVDPDHQRVWIDRLAEPSGASGALIRLGVDQLGRLPT